MVAPWDSSKTENYWPSSKGLKHVLRGKIWCVGKFCRKTKKENRRGKIEEEKSKIQFILFLLLLVKNWNNDSTFKCLSIIYYFPASNQKHYGRAVVYLHNDVYKPSSPWIWQTRYYLAQTYSDIYGGQLVIIFTFREWNETSTLRFWHCCCSLKNSKRRNC